MVCTKLSWYRKQSFQKKSKIKSEEIAIKTRILPVMPIFQTKKIKNGYKYSIFLSTRLISSIICSTRLYSTNSITILKLINSKIMSFLPTNNNTTIVLFLHRSIFYNAKKYLNSLIYMKRKKLIKLN